MTGHAFFTIRTPDQTGEGVNLSLSGGSPGVPLVDLLGHIKHFTAYNGGNSVFHNKPFAFRDCGPLVDLVADNLLPALPHNANIQLILKHTPYRCRIP